MSDSGAKGDQKGSGAPPTQSIALVLNNAKEVFFGFDRHSYRGDILDFRLGEYILFRARTTDDGLIRVPVGYEKCVLRTKGEDGKSFSFPTTLIQKKIPHLLISFPEKMDAEHVRGQQRYFMQQDAPLMVKKRENRLLQSDLRGFGTITNISKGGVQLNTILPLDKGDKLQVFMEVVAGGKKKKLVMNCVVRRSDPKGKLFNLGLEFLDPSEDAVNAIGAFLAAR